MEKSDSWHNRYLCKSTAIDGSMGQTAPWDASDYLEYIRLNTGLSAGAGRVSDKGSRAERFNPAFGVSFFASFSASSLSRSTFRYLRYSSVTMRALLKTRRSCLPPRCLFNSDFISFFESIRLSPEGAF